MVYLFLFIAILCEVTATTALKAANGFTVLIPSVVTVAGYAGAFLFSQPLSEFYSAGGCLCRLVRDGNRSGFGTGMVFLSSVVRLGRNNRYCDDFGRCGVYKIIL